MVRFELPMGVAILERLDVEGVVGDDVTVLTALTGASSYAPSTKRQIARPTVIIRCTLFMATSGSVFTIKIVQK